ncbi:hypothetical protein [Streptomyces sp. NPDC006739]|uniref:hypothetical protein n=1 Tax=Streptomyces sp. NPDC006739 TaxID=3364763 RepID=UPI0036CBA3BF
MIIRGAALFAGVGAVVWGALLWVGPWEDTTAFRHASLCAPGVPAPAAAAHGCVARETGTVTGRHTTVEETSDEGGSSRTTLYWVTFRRASGATQTRQVVRSLYDVARTGDRAELETWEDSPVWITVSGQSDGFDPPREKGLMFSAVVVWVGLGLITGFLCSDGTVRGLLGLFGERAAGWTAVGGYTVWAVHRCLTYVMGTGDYAFLAGAGLFLVGIVAALFSLGWDETRPHATVSPVGRALTGWFMWRYRRRSAAEKASLPMCEDGV